MVLKCTKLFPSNVTDFGEVKDDAVQLSSEMKNISLSCTERMVRFAQQIIEGAVNALDERPPCGFTVAAIGSLARGEATPYSDLEYLFVVEEKSPKSEEYFELLAITSYFLIGSLKETKLSYMAVEELDGWFEDFSLNGFKIDGLSAGAGNIPTGNGVIPGNKNHFILTKEELVNRYRETFNSPVEKEAIRGDITAMFAYIKPIFVFESGDRLVSEVTTAISAMTPNTERRAINMKMLQADIKKFDFKPNKEGKTQRFRVHVKKDIFRFPSIFMLDLTQVMNIPHGDSTWDTLDRFLEDGAISESFHTTLSFLISSACFIRLAAYLHHNSHDDRMCVAPKTEQVTEDWSWDKGIEGEFRNWYPPAGLFFVMMSVLVPLKRMLDENLDKDLSTVWLTKEPIHSKWADKVSALYHCERVTDALDIIEKEFATIDLYTNTEQVAATISDEFPNYLKCVGDTLFRCLHPKEALVFFEHIAKCKGISEDEKTAADLDICNCHIVLNNPKQHESLKNLETGGGKRYDMNGMIFFNMGEYGDTRANLVKSEECYIHALAYETCLMAFFQSSQSPTPFNFKDKFIERETETLYQSLMATERERRLRMITIRTRNTIFNLMMLGQIYDTMGDYQAAEKYYWHCEKMFICLDGEETVTVERAVLYRVIGSNLGNLGRYKMSQDYSLKAINMYYEIYGEGRAHSDIAMVYSDLGYNANDAKEYTVAEEFYKKALDMYTKLAEKDGGVSESVGSTLFKMGNSYHDMGDHENAVNFCLQALRVYTEIHGSNSIHPKIAKILNNLGTFYEDLKQFDDAETYHFKALAVYQQIPGTDEDVARVLKNIAYCFMISNQNLKALEYYHKTLELYPTLEDNPHNREEHVIVLKLLGITYSNMERYDEAEQYYRKALDAAQSPKPKLYQLINEIYMLMKQMYEKTGCGMKAEECNRDATRARGEKIFAQNPQAFLITWLSSLTVTSTNGGDSD